ncbi:hypothetical protein D1823_05290 [Ruegeria sp. AD91A]|uniref:hypothetical protein n=1 Tax=Ruegeria sp. AD91A TaxID=2293862 RepID=UPI000E4D35AA|nr:hypothetical protein [Ruegeria sp. AD91A]AXT26038.1 hypothetical protein D1823_05290 [Ruegeria sp. AD91A]
MTLIPRHGPLYPWFLMYTFRTRLDRVRFNGGKNVQVIFSNKTFIIKVLVLALLGCYFISGFSILSVISWLVLGVIIALILGRLTDEDWDSDDDSESEKISDSKATSHVDDEKTHESSSSTAETASSSGSGGGDVGGGGDAGM